MAGSYLNAGARVSQRSTESAIGLIDLCLLQHGEVAVEFVAGDLAAVVGPFLALVAEEEVEDVLAEGLGDQLALLHDADGLVQVGGEGLDAHGAALCRGEGPYVVLGA